MMEEEGGRGNEIEKYSDRGKRYRELQAIL